MNNIFPTNIKSQERTMARTQREEQDRAYQISLERDRQIELERQRKREEELEQQRLVEQKKREKQEKLHRIMQERTFLAETFPQEPEQSKETVTVRFRFPDGSQSERRFRKDQMAKSLFEYVHVLPVLKHKGVTWEPKQNSELSNYELTTNFPKTALDMNKTLQESGVANALVFVREDNDEDEENSEIVEINE
jgi:FAS-associated factor 2